MRDGIRWIADVTYRSESGPVDVRHHLVELEELHDIVERGPDFYCIEDIRIVMARDENEKVKTLEFSATE